MITQKNKHNNNNIKLQLTTIRIKTFSGIYIKKQQSLKRFVSKTISLRSVNESPDTEAAWQTSFISTRRVHKDSHKESFILSGMVTQVFDEQHSQ